VVDKSVVDMASQKQELVEELFKKVDLFLKEAKSKEKSQRIIIDKELEERLKALGYIK